jgi:hypothetical protein
MKSKYLFSLGLAGVLTLASCKKTDPLPIFDDVNTFFNANKTEGTAYTINVDASSDTLVTASGTIFVFPQGAFSKLGDITLKIKETSNPAELLLTSSPNNIDSTFNGNALLFDVQTDGATLNPGKSFKIKFANKGVGYQKVSAKNTNWAYDNLVTLATSEPNAGDAVSVYSDASNTTVIYNKLGSFAASANPFAGKAKTKMKIKIYGFTNDVVITTFVVSKANNSVAIAKRLTENVFLTDSVAIGSELQFVSISYSQSKKYLGFANTVVQDTLKVPISLHLVSSEDDIKREITNYFK